MTPALRPVPSHNLESGSLAAAPGREEWLSLGCPIARKSPRPCGRGASGARGGPGREAGQGRASHIRGDVCDFRPQSDARPARGPPVPETQSPRSPLRTRRQCRGPSPGSVRLAVPRRCRYFRNSRQATARAQPAASAFERTAAPPGERMRTPVFQALAQPILSLIFLSNYGHHLSSHTQPRDCLLQCTTLLLCSLHRKVRESDAVLLLFWATAASLSLKLQKCGQ